MKKIKDNLYNIIELDDIAHEILQTKEFQRLRKIKQLGFNYLTLPGANHTRFEHSLGVYHLGKRIIKKHNSKGEIAKLKESKEFLMACLLHDIGHGPFSHTSEHFFGFNHEEMGVRILQNPNGEIHKILKKHNLLNGTCSVINKKHQNTILNKLLSSGVDLDRLDYLNRDSFYTGFDYGKININDVLDNLKFSSDMFFLAEEHKLIAENFFMSRYYMFSEVYLNNETRTYEAIVSYILHHCKQSKDIQIEELNEDTILNFYDDRFEALIDNMVLQLNDNKITCAWNMIKTNDISNLKLVQTKEEADIIIPSINKNIVDDKNSVFIFENSRFKKIQTANSMLNEFFIVKEELYFKINVL